MARDFASLWGSPERFCSHVLAGLRRGLHSAGALAARQHGLTRVRQLVRAGASQSSRGHSCPVVSPAALPGPIRMAVAFQEGESDAARSLDVAKYCLHPSYWSEQVTGQARFGGREEWIPPLPGQGGRVRLHKGTHMGGSQGDIFGSMSAY